jgi:uncharacterized protein
MTAVLVAIAMAVGLVGTIVPLVPGLLIIWVAGLVYGLIEGFGTLGGVAFAVMTLLLAMGTAGSYVLPHRAGVLAGAGKTSLRLGLVGAVIGFFVIPVLGLPIGAVAGVLLGERQRLGDWGAAWGTTRKVVVGFGFGALAEFGSGALMFGTWLIWLTMTAG